MLFSGCNEPVEEALAGGWIIKRETFTSNGQNVADCLWLNYIGFFKNHEFSFPGFRPTCWELENCTIKNASWTLLPPANHTYFVKITGASPCFGDKWAIRFKNDKKERNLVLEIVAGQFQFSAIKNFYDYESNEKAVERLVRLTNPVQNASNN